MKLPQAKIKWNDYATQNKNTSLGLHYYRLIGWYNFQLYCYKLRISILIPAREK